MSHKFERDDSNPRHNELRAEAIGVSVKVRHHLSNKRNFIAGKETDPADRSLSRRADWFKILPVKKNSATIDEKIAVEGGDADDHTLVIKLLIVGMD